MDFRASLSLLKGKRNIRLLIAVILSMIAFCACGSSAGEEPAETGAQESAALREDLEVVFSEDSGSFEEPFDLTLTGPEGWTIRYTVDGSLPTASSQAYSGPLRITDINASPNRLASAENVALMYYEEFGSCFVPDADAVAKANVIRAAAFSPDGAECTPVFTHTYFVGETYTERYGDIAVIQIVTDPENLLDYDEGILATGRIFDEWSQTEEGQEHIARHEWWECQGNYTQHGRDWERDAVFELFDGEDALTVSAPVGIRVRGGASRWFGQRSLNLYFREGDGLEYPLFPDLTGADGTVLDHYSTVSLRNGGNDAEWNKFRDPMISELASGMRFMTMPSRPAILFLNGEYWGILNIRQKYDDHALEDIYGVDRHNVVVIKEMELDEGEDEDLALYEELMSFAERDLTDPAEWDAFQQTVDILLLFF